MFGIHDNKVRERLLREANLTLAKTDEICQAVESMLAQTRAVEDSSTTAANAVKAAKEPPRLLDSGKPNFRECWNGGDRHEHKRKCDPRFGKTATNATKRIISQQNAEAS